MFRSSPERLVMPYVPDAARVREARALQDAAIDRVASKRPCEPDTGKLHGPATRAQYYARLSPRKRARALGLPR